jgi:hypothetical protein
MHLDTKDLDNLLWGSQFLEEMVRDWYRNYEYPRLKHLFEEVDVRLPRWEVAGLHVRHSATKQPRIQVIHLLRSEEFLSTGHPFYWDVRRMEETFLPPARGHVVYRNDVRIDFWRVSPDFKKLMFYRGRVIRAFKTKTPLSIDKPSPYVLLDDVYDMVENDPRPCKMILKLAPKDKSGLNFNFNADLDFVLDMKKLEKKLEESTSFKLKNREGKIIPYVQINPHDLRGHLPNQRLGLEEGIPQYRLY